jgi:hypothetical protein
MNFQYKPYHFFFGWSVDLNFFADLGYQYDQNIFNLKYLRKSITLGSVDISA